VKYKFSVLLVLFLSISLLSPIFAQTPHRKRTVETAKPSSTLGIKQDVSEALKIIEQNYAGDKLNYNKVVKASIDGMLKTLDPHSNYFDAEEYAEFKAEQRSEYFGIGASIINQRRDGKIDTYITATFEGSPAFRAGVRYGDRIAQVNGEDMQDKPSADVRDKIRGPRGSKVSLTLEKASTGKFETVDIIRDAVPQPSVPDYYMIKPGVGYIDMTRGFNYDTAEEMKYALSYLNEQGMKGLVLDLRGNPGGLLDVSVEVAAKFLKSNQIVVSQHGRISNRVWKIPVNETDQVPLVILVSRFSASASEIVSGALQDHDRALIVGENTFGKGLVQSIVPLEYGSGLTITTAKYYTPSGRLIQRDYSTESLYDYYKNEAEGTSAETKPTGPESRTDSGRVVYSGGGIKPDVAVKPVEITREQASLRNPIFFFTREVINGRIPGFDAYKVQRAIEFGHKVEANDFPITDALIQSLKVYLSKDKSWNVTPSMIDKNRDFVSTELRFSLVLSAYGRISADQVYTNVDPQVLKAIEVLPQAKELAANAARIKKSQ